MTWSMTVPTRHVDEDGTALITGIFTKGGVERGTFTLALTEDNVLTLLWTVAEGAPELADMRAWQTR